MRLRKMLSMLLIAFVCSSVVSAELVMQATFDEVDGKTTVGQYTMLFNDNAAVTTGGGGRFGEALTLDGAGDRVTIEGYKAIGGNNPRTVCMWVKMATTQVTGLPALIAWGSGANGERFEIRPETSGNIGAVRVEIQSGSSTGTIKFNDDTWHHIAVSFPGGTCGDATMYVDGVADTNSAHTRQLATGSTNDVCIGNSFHGGFYRDFTGMIDDVRIYDEALDQGGVVAAMAAGDLTNIVSPENGATRLPVDTDLNWAEPDNYTPAEYKLYVSADDPNFLENNLVDGVTVAGGTTGFYDLPTLDNGKEYFWRVDSKKVTEWKEGIVWKFSTIPAVPVIDAGPTTQLVDPGADATFSLTGLNIVNYKWYQVGVAEPVSTDPAYVIPQVAFEDEAEIYCVVDNDDGAELESDHVNLYVKRVVGHWGFETGIDGLGDDGAVWTGEIVDPNELDEITPVIETVAGGVYGNALSMDSQGHIMVLDSVDAFNFYPHGLTVNAWVKSNAITDYRSIVSKHTVDNIGWVMNRISGYCGFTLRGANTVNTTGAITGGMNTEENPWHMITMQHDAVNQKTLVYIDGLLRNEAVQTNTILTNTNPLRIGANRDGELLFNGLIDELSIWNYAIDANTIAQLYADGSGNTICTGPVEFDFTGPEGEPDCIVNLYDFAAFQAQWMVDHIVSPELR
ncbi:MAG: hypothetical protein JEZ07_10070 [Phycisphaerae bacterium]|nr:hypothetical protein [Phycisphaerae bacterium]